MRGEAVMKTPTLVANRLYFGLEPLRLRDSTDRVLARVVGIPPERATVGLDAIAQDFRLGTAASRAIVDEMVQGGLLERLSPSGMEYGITEKFRVLAKARVIQPLPRRDAQMLISHIADTAGRFNRTAVSNKYEIAAIAVFGSYMSLDDDLPDVSIGVTGRHRPPAPLPASGRVTRPTEGTEALRALFEQQSSYLRVSFFQRLQEMPRPFSVIFRDDG
jgi:hypothetical protein